MTSLALLFVGFSVISALQIALTHFCSSHYSGQTAARVLGLVAVAALAGLQLAHWGWLYLDLPWVTSAVLYRMLLFVVAPAFWGFSRALLRTDRSAAPRLIDAAHALPVLIAPWLSENVALPLAFVVGAGYLLAVSADVYRLRAQREQFGRELLILGAVFIIALGVAGLGVSQAQLPGKLFYVLYASAIGLAFLLVQVALGLRPHLSEEVTETAKVAYAHSTLARVDQDAALARLAAAMAADRLYETPDLTLTALAQRLDLSAHQLSELINTTQGKNFSRYLREQRVAAAKAMLGAEPSASVLSVGLSVGFGTQSNFYEAFREIEGMTPGQYRRLHAQTAQKSGG